ncbi:MAG: hypothetical protein J2P17_19080 [Mycobacterium sp.]|nr:hypothetical protein [Mycobacterium sp.]
MNLGRGSMAGYSTTPVLWHQSATGLAIVVGEHTYAVPESITVPLIGEHGAGVSDDPATDLVHLESVLRLSAAKLQRALLIAENAVTAARGKHSSADTGHGVAARRQRRQLARQLKELCVEQNSAVEVLAEARRRVVMVRNFVAGLGVETGVLAASARGWQRDPGMPAWVLAFEDEDAFLAADPRRATTSDWGHSVTAMQSYGYGWRRDGDDDDPDADKPTLHGCWQAGYLPSTSEVAAICRADWLPDQVWLLATGVTPGAAHRVLSVVERHMLEPNSLIRLAEAVHADQYPPVNAEREVS